MDPETERVQPRAALAARETPAKPGIPNRLRKFPWKFVGRWLSFTS